VTEEDNDVARVLAEGIRTRNAQMRSVMESHRQREEANQAANHTMRINPSAALLNWISHQPLVLPEQSLLLQTVVLRGARTDEGAVIEAVLLPWFEIVEAITRDPGLAFKLSPEKWEEMLAGAYERAGFEHVTLTPRSGDLGRDVIAIKKGIAAIRVVDQMKAYKPGHLVTANDVRALLGVVEADKASKGFLTTTSDFAPRLRDDQLLKPLIGPRLELVNGTDLLARLRELSRR